LNRGKKGKNVQTSIIDPGLQALIISRFFARKVLMTQLKFKRKEIQGNRAR
jgi:hypothetical protein